MTERAAVILAAGRGTRMRSPLPKVLHKVGGRTLVDRAIDAAQAAGCGRIVVVVGAHSPEVGEHVEKRLGEGSTAIQDPPLGTAHAVRAAEGVLEGFEGDVLVTTADAPLLQAADLAALLQALGGSRLVVLGFEAADPAPYGRLIRGADGGLERIVEAKDATPAERAVTACNSGVLAARKADLFRWLARVGCDNAKGEYYLPDVVALAREDGAPVAVAFAPEAAALGVNSQAELAASEARFQSGRRAQAMEAGVAMAAPDTVHFAWDTQLAPGCTVEPYVVFAPGVAVEAAAVIRSFSHLEGARVGEGAFVGPYARLRPGAVIGREARIGNFVEVKNVEVGAGAKANHLAYLGDGAVGAKANIGAGTIFCNYDGFAKAKTEVGEGAFVGSNSALVAPVRIGAGAYVGSGSVIVRDVPDDALAIGRAEQVEKPSWAAKFRVAKAKR